MKKVISMACAAVVALSMLTSCGSTSGSDGKKKGKEKFDQVAFEAAYKEGNYDGCLAMLQLRNKKADILDEIDSSMLQYLKKDYLTSAKELVQTQQDMQQVTKDMTVAKVMEAAVLGENSVTYSGHTYERILAYSMKAANAFKMNEVDRAIGVMNEYTGNYKEEIAAIVLQQKEVAAKSENSTEDPKFKAAVEGLGKLGVNINVADFTKGVPAGGKEVYETSPFLSYLGVMAYAANNDPDHAKDFASVLATTNNVVSVAEDVAVPAGKGRLNVITLSDTIGKRADAPTQPVPVGQIGECAMFFKLAFPVFPAQKHNVSVKKVTLSSGESSVPVLLEDFDKAVEMDVLSKQKGAYYRSLFRNVVKGFTTAAAGDAAVQSARQALAKNASNPLAAKAGQIAIDKAVEALNKGLAAIANLERSDIRQGAFFPNKASVAGFTVAPGTYTVTVEYDCVVETKAEDGTVKTSKETKTDVIENVKVEAGKPSVVISERFNA